MPRKHKISLMEVKGHEDKDFNIKLVKAVEKYPCLYNNTLPEYFRRDELDKAWEEVGKEINENALVCREKWKNLRNVFTRKIRWLRAGDYGISGKANRTPYYLSEAIKFVLPYLKSTQNDSGNLDLQGLFPENKNESVNPDNDQIAYIVYNDDEDGESRLPEVEVREEVSETTFPKQSKKRKRESSTSNKVFDANNQHVSFDANNQLMCFDASNQQRTNDGDDYRKMFLMSLLPELYLLNEYQMRQFKRKVLQLIDDILDPQLTSQRYSSSNEYVNSTPIIVTVDQEHILPGGK